MIRARSAAGEFFPAEFLVPRVVFEALVRTHLAGAAPDAASAVARDAVTRFGPSSDLIATSAVIRRALDDDPPEPPYLGFGEEIDGIWVRVSLAIVGRHPTRPARIRELILGAERTAARWRPRVALTPAAARPPPGRRAGGIAIPGAGRGGLKAFIAPSGMGKPAIPRPNSPVARRGGASALYDACGDGISVLASALGGVWSCG